MRPLRWGAAGASRSARSIPQMCDPARCLGTCDRSCGSSVSVRLCRTACARQFHIFVLLPLVSVRLISDGASQGMRNTSAPLDVITYNATAPLATPSACVDPRVRRSEAPHAPLDPFGKVVPELVSHPCRKTACRSLMKTGQLSSRQTSVKRIKRLLVSKPWWPRQSVS